MERIRLGGQRLADGTVQLRDVPSFAGNLCIIHMLANQRMQLLAFMCLLTADIMAAVRVHQAKTRRLLLDLSLKQDWICASPVGVGCYLLLHSVILTFWTHCNSLCLNNAGRHERQR